jgi:penicillin-binding protein 2
VNGDNPRLRLSLLGIVAVSLFAALFARLWYLQVMTSGQFQAAATTNSTRDVPVEAPRGRILDRNGNVIVGNRISVQVTIDRSALDDLSETRRQKVLERLADALSRSGVPKTVKQLQERVDDERFSPFVPVPIANDVPETLKIWVDEHGDELPSVAADFVAVRSYPYGRLAAHVIGYTGRITQGELDSPEARALDTSKPYTLNDEIGKYGIEREYEADLRGKPGQRLIEVDAQGKPVRIIEEDPPVPGDDVVLNLDVNLQAVTEQALKSGLDRAATRPANGTDHPNVGRVGSSVVLDPTSGAVLAMASYPTFNPADFVDGISNTEWQFLQAPENYHPLNNYALQGQYAPGSTFKPFVASAGLISGLLPPSYTIHDDGSYEIPGCKGEPRGCVKYNDGRAKYGTVNIQRSLTVSSDVFYYGVGAQFWIQRDSYQGLGGPEAFRTLLEQWGFDQKTGIDLPGEQDGRIPSQAWKKQYCEQVKKKAPCIDDRWFTGDSVNTAVGQGDDLVTPLQLASAYAALGNGGQRWRPEVAQQVLDGVTHEVKRRIDPQTAGDPIVIPPEGRASIINGMVGVTTNEAGTAFGAFSGFNSSAFPVAAKTGTAQVSNKAPTAVFGAFGPAPAPQYAVSVFLAESGYGGSAAAPVARRVFDVLSQAVPMPDARETLNGPDTQLAEGGNVRDR